MCVASGCITPQFDNFTSISTRGRSVVDYIAVIHTSMRNCVEYRVTPSNVLVDEYKIQGLISQYCRVPDHSYLGLSLNLRVGLCVDNNNPGAVTNPINSRKYKYDFLPDNFLCSEVSKSAIQELIDRLCINDTTQNDLDKIYQDFTSNLFQEMDSNLHKVKVKSLFWVHIQAQSSALQTLTSTFPGHWAFYGPYPSG